MIEKHVAIPCKDCNGTGLGDYPHECYSCGGTGIAKYYDNTQIKQWFEAFKKEIDKRDVEISKLKEGVGELRLLITALVVGQTKDELTKNNLKYRLDNLRQAFSRIQEDDLKIGDKDIYDLEIVNDDTIQIRFADNHLTVEEEMVKDVIE